MKKYQIERHYQLDEAYDREEIKNWTKRVMTEDMRSNVADMVFEPREGVICFTPVTWEDGGGFLRLSIGMEHAKEVPYYIYPEPLFLPKTGEKKRNFLQRLKYLFTNK